MNKPTGMAAYIAVTAAYWAFMLSDGALRMLVLLHFHTLGFSPVQLAYLFLLYEIAGIITNLSAGWIAARFGLSSTLYAGLALQILALIALLQLSPDWTIWASVAYVMFAQGLSGVAKDLSKMSAKSAVKLLAPKTEGGLFRWVAILTGSKNAVKGLGFFVGAVALGTFGFHAVIQGMAIFLGVILLVLILRMPAGLPTGRKDVKFKDVLSKNTNVNWLSLARVFLFGARDVWFVVGIPIYFYAFLSDGSTEGNRNAFFLIGGFMAIWIILYGLVQGNAHRILRATMRGSSALIQDAARWAWILLIIPICLSVFLYMRPDATTLNATVVVTGLLVFGAIFAINSSLHSYLILEFSTGSRVTLDVGFYYMANASGRLLGTLLSGISYQLGGVIACLSIAAFMLALSAFAAGRLKSS
ncbi:MAG: MFS transporter [Rhodobacteraceae bacterium]|jgi:MFS family permease|nr:MFS transporter [Paracoccaceae bacterium]NCV30881.1 MFS transporter [Paracoccaceae bacterium]NCW05122.1 MFS transporter [Paracoccaceae bacterium]NCW62065.1 MFS transporter [Paracoccaceae bacterium]NCX20279.1 MFS transporter [Paracoccaceae bacterium]